MRKPLLLLICLAIAYPALAGKRVNVQRFKEVVASVEKKPDADAADKLSQFELTERISPARMTEWDAAMPGPKARAALLILVDASSFSPLSVDEGISEPAPDAGEQHAMLDASGLYVAQSLSRLPNFFATRETVLFMDAPQAPGSGIVPAEQAMSFAARSIATVLYRDGKEVVAAEAEKGKNKSPAGLITSGEFGPILGTALADARTGELTFSHWELIEKTKAAVFHYVVTKPKSHYEAKFCCVTVNGGRELFKRLTGYHGEISLDPANGTILRITMQADLKPPYPMSRADLLVEYGPVAIGGRSYICPVRSIALVRGYEPAWIHLNGDPHNFAGSLYTVDDANAVSAGPEVLQTLMNHVVFKDYHLFRSDARILTDPDSPSPDPPAKSSPH
jgi:hypothetical protein